MNETLQKVARENLKKGLAKLEDKHRHLFRRMYSPGDLDMHIDEVVDKMPADRLDWAMQQVECSVHKLEVEEIL